MQANPHLSTSSFIEQARRQQIVRAAIATIAAQGYGKASFARIAAQAGLKSTGLISYHFAGKQELNSAVAAFVLEDLGAWMHQRLHDVEDPAAALASYIRALTVYMQQRPDHLQALGDLVLHGALDWSDADQRTATSALEEILRRGQDAGAFRSFDVLVMATTIQRSLDGLPFLQRGNPDLDLAAYADELVDLFHLATRAERGAP